MTTPSSSVQGASGALWLQTLQARRAFQPDSARQSPAPEPAAPAEMDFTTPVEPRRASATGKAPLPYEDIRAVANQAGFIGLSEGAIERAYLTGESLLADHRV